MDKIVQKGVKIDLHIHSDISSCKDGKKVKSNTEENIPILIEKLNQNEVNICAITDHDTFSYSIYRKLKEAEMQNNSILKVLPGVEFSVYFETDEASGVIHIITIFSDRDDNKVKEIESILNEMKFDKDDAFSENEFLEILRKISVDTILIAHQKNSLSSHTARKHDANSLGTDRFLEFVYTDYFEAFEFKNRRSEILNKDFLMSRDIDDRVHFVTGTDCHDWSVYPAEDPKDHVTGDFPYTYAKCLPTFKGLVMAMTDHTRLKMVNSFFNVQRHCVDNITLTTHNIPVAIPLSKGINAIIGDNSIGKSLLLHAMTKFTKPGISKIKIGYQKYLKENEIKISTHISDDCIFCFDMQGEVRSKFEENKLNATEFLKDYFPADIDPRPFRVIVDNEINRMIDYLERKFLLDTQIANLKSFDITITDDQAESLTFINQPLKKSKLSTDYLIKISSKIEEIVVGITELTDMHMDQVDIDYVNGVKEHLSTINRKYDLRFKDIKKENDRIEKIATILTKTAQRHTKSISDKQKKHSTFSDNTNNLKDELTAIIRKIRACFGMHTYEYQASQIMMQAS